MRIVSKKKLQKNKNRKKKRLKIVWWNIRCTTGTATKMMNLCAFFSFSHIRIVIPYGFFVAFLFVFLNFLFVIICGQTNDRQRWYKLFCAFIYVYSVCAFADIITRLLSVQNIAMQPKKKRISKFILNF